MKMTSRVVLTLESAGLDLQQLAKAVQSKFPEEGQIKCVGCKVEAQTPVTDAATPPVGEEDAPPPPPPNPDGSPEDQTAPPDETEGDETEAPEEPTGARDADEEKNPEPSAGA